MKFVVYSSSMALIPVQSYLSGQKLDVGWSLLELLGPSATTTEFYRLSGQQELAKRDFWVRACAASARAHVAQLPNCSAAQLLSCPLLASRLGQQRAGWPLHCCCSSSKVWGSAHLVVCVTPAFSRKNNQVLQVAAAAVIHNIQNNKSKATLNLKLAE